MAADSHSGFLVRFLWTQLNIDIDRSSSCFYCFAFKAGIFVFGRLCMLKQMPLEEIKQFCRHLRVASVDVHPSEKALLVNYELDPGFGDKYSEGTLKEAKSLIKLIHIKDLSPETDVTAVADEIIEKCKYIPMSMHLDVEHSLIYLQKRKDGIEHSKKENAQDIAFGAKGSEILKAFHLKYQELVANMESLDDYIELLYEGDEERIKGCSLVLQLFRKPKNLFILSKKDPLIGALARVLREDGKKKMELSTLIVYIFFCFSAFRQFHFLISQHKVGSTCMDLIEFELKRYDQWTEDLEKLKNCVEEDKSSPSSLVDFEKHYNKYVTVVKKQDQLLRLCFYLLYNIGEDSKIELKMVNRGIVSFLSRSLKRCPELQTLCLMFLKRLSIYMENKHEMMQNNVVENMMHLISHSNAEIQSMALRLLWNLSFDIELRSCIVRCAFVPKIVDLIINERCANAALSILYHISVEDRYKAVFTYIDCIPIVVDLLTKNTSKVATMPLIAFGINLALNKRNAQIMCTKHCLDALINKSISAKDSLMMKMVRNLSLHEGTKEKFVRHIDAIFKAIKNAKHGDDFVLECLGTLGNLSIPQANFHAYFQQYNFVRFMKRLYCEGTVKDDVMLELINILSAAAVDKDCAAMILKSEIMKMVIEFLEYKQEDDEIVLQTVYLFYKIIYHCHTDKAFILKSNMPAYVLDLMTDKNPEIRRVCDLCLEMISRDNDDWAKRIQGEKFRFHNCQWLEMVESQQIDENDYCVDDTYTPCIQESDDLLSSEDLLYGCDAYESLLSEGSISPSLYEDPNV